MQGGSLDIRHLIVEDKNNNHPSEANGLHQVARSLALEQNRAGDSARIFYVPAGEQNRPPAGVPVTTVMPKGPDLRGLRLWADDAVLLEDASSQTFFHIHGVRQPLLVSLTYALRRRGIPYAVTGHSRYAHMFTSEGSRIYWKTRVYARLLERGFLEKARFLHALTDLEAEELRRIAPRARIAIVQNGIFSGRLGGMPRAPMQRLRSPNYPVFGFFGRLAVRHKGLDLLVAGFARYKEAGGAGRLEIMGTDAAERQALQESCQAAGVGRHVSIIEPRFGDAKDEVLKRWDFFVMPSRFDRMPLAALDAALIGLPLILTDSTGWDLRGHKAGLPIMDHSAEAVAAALFAGEALSAEKWHDYSLAAHRMAKSSGDWTAIAETLRNYYVSPFAHNDNQNESEVKLAAVPRRPEGYEREPARM